MSFFFVQERVQRMLVYIHTYYADELTLKNSMLNVTKISESVGFNNVTHFIQVLKITKEI